MPMSVPRRLAEAIESWLHFEYCCFRAGLFSESSLKSAVGQVLSSLPIEEKGARVHADYPHIALNPNKKRGRKNEVDFALILDAKGNEEKNADVVVEVKWANSSHCTPDNILKDFLRLAMIKSHSPKTKCVFILAGPLRNITKKINMMPFKSDGKINNGIGTTTSERRLKMTNNPALEKMNYAQLLPDYFIDQVKHIQSLVTKSYGWQAMKIEKKSSGFHSVTWEVVSVECSSEKE